MRFPMSDEFDYVIVGSGPAGSLLAKRLSEDRAATVCVLEAGVADASRWVRIPAGFVKMVHDPAFQWLYESEPNPALGGRAVRITQGRKIGRAHV